MTRLICTAGLMFIAACSGGGDNTNAGAGESAALPVDVSLAFTDTVVDAIIANGEIQPLQQIELRPEVEGRVIELLFREGQTVPEGAALVRIDDAELKAQVARAIASRDLAGQALDRTRQLVTDRAAAQADLERAEATARVAEAELALLQVRLDRTTVRAPFGGVIGQRLVSLGDYVTSQRALLTLQTVSPQRVVFSVPERYATEVSTGQTVTFRVGALPGRDFTATVDFVDPVLSMPSRGIMVKAVAPNPGGELQAGMFIEARLATDTRGGATIVPEEAISPAAGASYVWVVEQGRAVRREVELGIRTPGFVEVRSGVSPGEQVIIGGVDRVFENAEVNATVVERRPQGVREG